MNKVGIGRRVVVVEISSTIVVEVGASVVVVVVASSVVSVEICVEEIVESLVDSSVVVDSVVPADSMVVLVEAGADVVTEASADDVNSSDVERTDVEINESSTDVLVTSVDVVTEISDDATEVVDPRSVTEVDSETAIVVVAVNSVCSLDTDDGAEELKVEEKVESEMVVVVESDCSVAFVASVDNVEDSPRLSVVVAVVMVANLSY